VSDLESEVVYGWRSIAETVGCSERHVRDIVTRRQLIATRRADGAVGVRRADLASIGQELGRAHSTHEGAEADRPSPLGTASTAAQPRRPPPTLRAVPSATALDTVVRDAEETGDIAVIDGDVAAAMFAAFEEGQTPVEVVVSTKRSPAVVEANYSSWRRLKSMDVSSPQAETRLGAVETALLELRAKLDSTSSNAGSLSNPTLWATPLWKHDGLASRLAVIEQVLLGRGMLVRRTET
jgi:hypothetical protein